MDLDLSRSLALAAVYAIPLIFAVTVHETAHGLAARYFGDTTAASQGRLSLNPVNHIDPVGTVVVPIICMAFMLPVFGWAKPVPIDPARMRNPRRDMAIVSLAGPLSNFLMAVIWTIVWGLAANAFGPGPHSGDLGSFVLQMAQAGVFVNIVLMIFNLIPVPPLDGSKIVAYFLPAKWLRPYLSLGRYGLFIVMFLIFSGILTPVLSGGLNFFVNLLTRTLF